jgi:hypothetical protein
VVCGVSGTTVTLRSAGACRITASQAGNDAWDAASQVTRRFTLGYDVTNLVPTTRSLFTPGSMVQSKFQLTGDSGSPIPDRVARNLDCTVHVRFDSTKPVCASYDARLQRFEANLATPRNLARGSLHAVTVVVRVGRLPVATARTTIIAR